MITYSYDIEVTPNYLSVAAINIREYLATFSDIVDKKGHPVPLTDKLSVAEIVARLDKITKHSFVMHDNDGSQLLNLISFLNQEADIFGYNSSKYDKLMLSAIRMYYNRFDSIKEFLKFMYETSQRIIRASNNDMLWYDNFTKSLITNRSTYRDIDLMKIFRLDFYHKSLKQVSINIKWYNLLEFAMPPISEIDAHYYYENIPSCKGMDIDYLNRLYCEVWHRYVPPEYCDTMNHYNFNDVFICCDIIRLNPDEIKLRYSISEEYKINVYSDSRSVIADKVLTKLYSNATGLKPEDFRDRKTIRKKVDVADIVLDYIKFETPQLQEFLKEFKLRTIYKDDKFTVPINFYGTEYTVAAGGLHSVDTPDFYKTVAGVSYIKDADGDSFYPSSVISNKIHPAHIPVKIWIKLISGIVNDRLNNKFIAADNSKPERERFLAGVKAGCLKIVINSGVFGKMGSEDSFICDIKAMYTVTINGQLMLLMWIEKLELSGIHCISANTDGIVCEIPHDKLETYYEIGKWWTEVTGIGISYTDYDVYVREQVNSYATVKPGGKCKYKGRMNPYLCLEDLSKGFNNPIVATAVTEYFFNDTPVMDTLRASTNILDFCKTQNVARKYCLEYFTVVKGEIVRTKLQRNTRYYISTVGGSLYKVLEDDFDNEDYRKIKRSALTAGQTVNPCNLVEDKPLYEYNIDYMYYYNEAMAMINPIKLNIRTKGKGKSRAKKTFGMYNKLFEEEADEG